jgi:hypothetical protein
LLRLSAQAQGAELENKTRAKDDVSSISAVPLAAIKISTMRNHFVTLTSLAREERSSEYTVLHKGVLGKRAAAEFIHIALHHR